MFVVWTDAPTLLARKHATAERKIRIFLSPNSRLMQRRNSRFACNRAARRSILICRQVALEGKARSLTHSSPSPAHRTRREWPCALRPCGNSKGVGRVAACPRRARPYGNERWSARTAARRPAIMQDNLSGACIPLTCFADAFVEGSPQRPKQPLQGSSAREPGCT
jgi:hypothetical protein